MRTKLMITAAMALIFPITASALPACYQAAQKAFQSAGSISKAKLIPSDRWVAMTQSQKHEVGNAHIVSAVNSSSCRQDEVLKGGTRVSERKLSVPYGFLYSEIAHAVIKGDKKRLIYLHEHAKPANKSVEALFDLYGEPPPGTAGGWSVFAHLVKLYRINLDQGKWLNWGLLALFKQLGGQAVHDCKPHHPPASMVAPGIKPDTYRNVLAAFDLKEGQVLSGAQNAAQRTFKLEGCTQ